MVRRKKLLICFVIRSVEYISDMMRSCRAFIYYFDELNKENDVFFNMSEP